MPSGPQDIIWEIEGHTKIKLKILQNYLNAWLPIMSKWNDKLLYIDGFAGPGEYKNYPKGSPIIALECYRNHVLGGHLSDVYFLFIEKNEERYMHLTSKIKKEYPDLFLKRKIHIVNDRFDRALSQLLQEIGDSTIISSFVFIDPFGYSGYPLDLLAEFWNKCKRPEYLITFTVDSINRFSPNTPGAIDELYGDNKWRKCLDLEGDEKIKCFVGKYRNALQERLGNVYIHEFKMINRYGHPVYFLIFITKSNRGLEMMKEAMFRTTKSFNYSFSDRVGHVESLLSFDNDVWYTEATKWIYNRFRGTIQRVYEIKKAVVEESPWLFRKKILKILEDEGKIKVMCSRRKKGTYPDDCRIEFL